jgi:hypothetical protein
MLLQSGAAHAGALRGRGGCRFGGGGGGGGGSASKGYTVEAGDRGLDVGFEPNNSNIFEQKSEKSEIVYLKQ